MASRGLDEWAALELEAGGRGSLLRRCGNLDIGNPLQSSFQRILEYARSESDFEILSAAEVRARWPSFAGLPDEWAGVWDKEGGILSPDTAVPALQKLASQAGATLRGDVCVESLSAVSGHGSGEGESDGGHGSAEGQMMELTLSNGEGVLRARRVVLAAGAWTSHLLRTLFGFEMPLDVWEITFGWYKVRADCFSGGVRQLAASMPVWRAFGGRSRCYGFPLHERDDAVKIAPHGSPTVDVHRHPSERSHAPNGEYIRETSAFASELFPGMLAPGKAVELEPHTCLYSVTRDGSFVLDWLPPSHAPEGAVLVLGGFCGSGFKHGPLIGRMAQEMVSAAARGDVAAMRSPPSFPDIDAFSVLRPGLTADASDAAGGSRLLAEHEDASRPS